MGYWKVMDTYKAGSTSGDGSLEAYLLGYSFPCLSAPWSPWTEQFSFAILPTTSAISQPLKQGDCMIIDENLWNGKCSFSLSGLFSAFCFFFLTVTEAARHREDRGEGALNLTEENLSPVWEGGPGQAEKSKELTLVTLQLGVAAPALLDLDWSHCRAEGVQTCQPHSRDRRYNRLDRERKHFLHSSEWTPPNHLFFWFLKLGSFLLIPSLPRFV